jgi:hypothetical protein
MDGGRIAVRAEGGIKISQRPIKKIAPAGLYNLFSILSGMDHATMNPPIGEDFLSLLRGTEDVIDLHGFQNLPHCISDFDSGNLIQDGNLASNKNPRSLFIVRSKFQEVIGYF